MSIKISTGFRDHMLQTGDLQSALDGGVIRIYAGTEPATADAAISGPTLLCIISNNDTGTGITMAASSSAGVLGKNASEVWSGTILANGTAAFYRFSPTTDDLSLSTSIKRLQGSVGLVGADLVFSSVAFVAPNLKSIDSFFLAIPTA